MCLGLPIISTNVGGIPFIINHGENGLLVEKDDEQMMYDYIKELIELPELVTKLTKNAQVFSQQFFWENIQISWDRIIKKATNMKVDNE